MKRAITIILAAAIASISAMAYAAGQTQPLPEEISAFLAKHFPGKEILKVEKDVKLSGSEYEVNLAGGAEIDFDTALVWKDVKAGRGSAVPSGIVPKAISSFVEKHHPGSSIVEISRKRVSFEIELSDGTELELSKNGKLLKYD